MATKWGICSAGKISHDFVTSVRSLKSDDHQFVAVAARELKSAKHFAELHKIPEAYGSYEELANDPEVEVVYIGTINSAHLSAAKLMLEHGKHVLVEKSLTLNTKQSQELFVLAKQRKLFAMEAIWSRFLPSYQFIFEQIENGVIGDVKYVNATLSYNKPDMTRATGSSTVLDVGVYVINLVEQAFNGETPEKVEAVGHLNNDGVDMDFSVCLKYKNNRTATCTGQNGVELPNDAVIVGTKGIIRLAKSFHSTQEVYINDKLYKFKFPTPILKMNYGSAGLCYQANEVRRCLKAGLLESPHMSHSDSLTISRIEDTIRKQIGATFDVD